ncbi:TPA: helix-turn-helix transcriptional regulator [Enterococcus faecium]|nr:helix-turn-helix transcriptional regulator [Enterococcus faecium]EME7210172.1 helix-turn-helix transcriptional regulator [Enterococcus faecium]HDO7719110.1 helix-turn-helix transcriptional regulator [Enterococcus faecium]HDO7779578.1 helix-turn-helix transcriptional regulator [Enterococcus faecium]
MKRESFHEQGVRLIKYYMTTLNLTQRDLAKKVGVRDEQISKILHGKNKLSADMLEKIATAIDRKVILVKDYYVYDDETNEERDSAFTYEENLFPTLELRFKSALTRYHAFIYPFITENAEKMGIHRKTYSKIIKNQSVRMDDHLCSAILKFLNLRIDIIREDDNNE